MSGGASKHALTLECVTGRFAICRLDPDQPIEIPATPFCSITKTAEELSLVLPEERIPAGARSETGWRLLKVQGPLAFEQTGVLASLVEPLARAAISVFAISTYDTDYLLVRDSDFDSALEVLENAGHRVR